MIITQLMYFVFLCYYHMNSIKCKIMSECLFSTSIFDQFFSRCLMNWEGMRTV
jgi:hypothetical protein